MEAYTSIRHSSGHSTTSPIHASEQLRRMLYLQRYPARWHSSRNRGLRLVRAVLAGDPDPAPRSPRYVSSVKWQPSRCSTRTSGRRLFRDGQAVAHLPQDQYGQGATFRTANMLGALQGWPSYGSLPTRVQALCWSRPHPGRRQSQYSWAHMDPSAHSLAFRGGAEVPDEV